MNVFLGYLDPSWVKILFKSINKLPQLIITVMMTKCGRVKTTRRSIVLPICPSRAVAVGNTILQKKSWGARSIAPPLAIRCLHPRLVARSVRPPSGAVGQWYDKPNFHTMAPPLGWAVTVGWTVTVWGGQLHWVDSYSLGWAVTVWGGQIQVCTWWRSLVTFVTHAPRMQPAAAAKTRRAGAPSAGQCRLINEKAYPAPRDSHPHAD
eukprot:359930-Chlamydomonas_euryale.AAC.4